MKLRYPIAPSVVIVLALVAAFAYKPSRPTKWIVVAVVALEEIVCIMLGIDLRPY